jgi:hypothetical protein
MIKAVWSSPFIGDPSSCYRSPAGIGWIIVLVGITGLIVERIRRAFREHLKTFGFLGSFCF